MKLFSFEPRLRSYDHGAIGAIPLCPKKAADPPAPPTFEDCDYCGQQISSAGDPLVGCVSYVEVSNPKEATWHKDHQAKLCKKALHLGCARAQQASAFKGTVSIDAAGRNVIGFCSVCFPQMEANRPDAEPGEDEAPAPAPAAGQAP